MGRDWRRVGIGIVLVSGDETPLIAKCLLGGPRRTRDGASVSVIILRCPMRAVSATFLKCERTAESRPGRAVESQLCLYVGAGVIFLGPPIGGPTLLKGGTYDRRRTQMRSVAGLPRWMRGGR